MRSGLGMGMRGRCASIGRGYACAGSRKAAIRRQKAASSAALCELRAAFGTREARAWGWARAQHMKGIWWMPWHREAMKDVARCEKPRGSASNW